MQNSNSVNKALVALDFDGVICDSFVTALRIFQIGDPLLTATQLRDRFAGNFNLAARIGDASFNFFDIYAPLVKDLPLFTGMDAVIRTLSDAYTLVIISSTITPPIEEFLKEHGLLDNFADVLGNDKGTRKDEKLRTVLEHYHTTPADCVFITDTLGDLKEGQKVGVHTIATTWGYHDQSQLEQGNPERLATSPDQLPQHVSNLLSAT